MTSTIQVSEAEADFLLFAIERVEAEFEMSSPPPVEVLTAIENVRQNLEGAFSDDEWNAYRLAVSTNG